MKNHRAGCEACEGKAHRECTLIITLSTAYNTVRLEQAESGKASLRSPEACVPPSYDILFHEAIENHKAQTVAHYYGHETG